MVKGGVNCVTTANNHCLDQGIEGLVRTIKELDRNKVYIRVLLHMRTASKRILYLYLNHIVIALIRIPIRQMRQIRELL